MKIKLLLFGMITDVTGQPEMEIEDVASITELRLKMEEQYSGLVNCRYAVAVNKTMVHGNAALNDGDTVAFLPPFSGG